MEAELFTCPREKNKERDLLAGINSEGLLERTFMTTVENRIEKKSRRRVGNLSNLSICISDTSKSRRGKLLD